MVKTIRTKISNINKPNYQQIRFEILDIDQFPSISEKMGCITDMNSIDIAKLGNPLNDQQIIVRIRPDSVVINAKLFTLDDDDFVEAISVGSNDMFLEKYVPEESIQVESIEQPEFDGRTIIIEDYCKSK
jgi:hypothetical protein